MVESLLLTMRQWFKSSHYKVTIITLIIIVQYDAHWILLPVAKMPLTASLLPKEKPVSSAYMLIT